GRPQAFDAEVRRRQIDSESDPAMRARAEAAALRDLERVLAVVESPRSEDEARPLPANARGDVASVERPMLLLERPVLRADRECQRRETCAADWATRARAVDRERGTKCRLRRLGRNRHRRDRQRGDGEHDNGGPRLARKLYALRRRARDAR